MRRSRAGMWRWVRRGVVAMCVGVVVNVVVAWGCVLWSPVGVPVRQPETTWPREVPERWPDYADSSEWHGIGVSRLESFNTWELGAECVTLWSRSGWPMHAMEFYTLIEQRSRKERPYLQLVSMKGEAGWTALAGTEVPAGNLNSAGPWRRLPLVALWPGFTVNVLFYAFVWLGLLRVPHVVRRGRRMRRGECGACGYDVAGIAGGVCPECGWGVG